MTGWGVRVWARSRPCAVAAVAVLAVLVTACTSHVRYLPRNAKAAQSSATSECITRCSRIEDDDDAGDCLDACPGVVEQSGQCDDVAEPTRQVLCVQMERGGAVPGAFVPLLVVVGLVGLGAWAGSGGSR